MQKHFFIAGMMIFVLSSLCYNVKSQEIKTIYLTTGVGFGINRYNPEDFLSQAYQDINMTKTGLYGSLSFRAGFRNYIQYEYNRGASYYDFNYKTGGSSYWSSVPLPGGGSVPTLLVPGESQDVKLRMREHLFKLNLFGLKKSLKSDKGFIALNAIYGKGRVYNYFSDTNLLFMLYKPSIYGIEIEGFTREGKYTLNSFNIGMKFYDVSDQPQLLSIKQFNIYMGFSYGIGY